VEVLSKWDTTIAVGQLVTAYASGYHIVVSFSYREGRTPIAYYRRVLDARGGKTKPGKDQHCDAAWLKKLSVEDVLKLFDLEAQQAAAKRDNLLEYLPA
jgi:hypothetical protein